MLASLCPSLSDTSFMFAPAESNIVAWVCLKWWNVMPLKPYLAVRFEYLCPRLFRLIGLPCLSVNTRESSATDIPFSFCPSLCSFKTFNTRSVTFILRVLVSFLVRGRCSNSSLLIACRDCSIRIIFTSHKILSHVSPSSSDCLAPV